MPKYLSDYSVLFYGDYCALHFATAIKQCVSSGPQGSLPLDLFFKKWDFTSQLGTFENLTLSQTKLFGLPPREASGMPRTYQHRSS